MSALIRKATIDDLPTIQRLGFELMQGSKEFDPLLTPEWHLNDEGRDYLLKQIKGRNHICFVAEEKGKIIGYASCEMLKVKELREVKRAEIGELFVREHYRNHGIGHQLVASCKQWAKARNAKKVKVEAYSLNKDGLRFYEDTGFKPILETLEVDL